MTVRRLLVDAAVVAVLVVASAASGASLILVVDSSEITKKLGLPAEWWHTHLFQWWLATVVGMAAMLVRSWQPLVALAATTGMTLVHANSPVIPFMPVDLAALIALFTVASRDGRRWVSYAALGFALAASLLPAAYPAIRWLGLLLPPMAVVAAWLFGDRARTRRAYLEQVSQRALDLERERDQQAELATVAERARIARELHDAVAHGLSVIVIQAQAAAGSMERRPATARAALSAIVATGRDSLTEMRRLLGLTRPDGQELAPLPGLADLATLVDRIRAAGLTVTLTETGSPEGLPTGIGLTVYRITQEALTNALKHAGPSATVDVSVHYGLDTVGLRILDTGPGAGGPPDERRGNGLRGMRERVAMLGGTLTAADRPGGTGFGVFVRLPRTEAG
jgi:signal transduction histidine kinase